MTKLSCICWLFLLFTQLLLFSQHSSKDTSFQIHGGIDYYYGIQWNDFNQEEIPIYVSSNQLGQAAINLALLEISYNPTSHIRLQFSPGLGTYMKSNYSAENKNVSWIYESYAGFKPNTERDEWIDFGVFTSPYTFENANTWGQVMYNRSLAPEYVPYYLLGVRYKRKINDKLQFTSYLLNGWQRIEIQKKIPSIGTQLEYKKGNHYLSWTTYQGNEKTDQQPEFGYRAFTELSWIYSINKLKILSCGYVGMQMKSGSPKYWGQVNLTSEYKILDRLLINGRIEQFFDPNNIQISRVNFTGFNCSGLSLGVHWKVSENMSIRIENKLLRDNRNVGYFQAKNQSQRFLPISFLGIDIFF